MNENFLDIIAKLATILTGGIAAYFLIKDRMKIAKFSLILDEANTSLSVNDAGGIGYNPLLGIKGIFINKGTFPLNIDKIELKLDSETSDCRIYYLDDRDSPCTTPTNENKPLGANRKRVFFYSGKEIAEKVQSGKQSIRIQIFIHLENGTVFKSKRLNVRTVDLTTQ